MRVRKATKILCSLDLKFLIYRIQFLRDVSAFFGTSFKIGPAETEDLECTQLLYSCYGTGYVNANRTLA